MTQPIIKRSNIRNAVGVEVDTLSVSLVTNLDVQQNNIPLAQFALQGGFDGANLTVNRFYAASWTEAPTGSLFMFTGRVSDVNVSGTEIKMEIKSPLELLNIKMPRNLYQAGCIHALYDVNCGANAAGFTSNATVGAGSTRSVINTDLGQASGYFNLGVVTFSSGENSGESRTIKSFDSGIVTTSYPFQFAPAEGDEAQVRPGCDKLQATCNAKFDNLANFRAFPYIPVPEAGF